MQDKYAMFDIASDLTLAGASGVGFGGGAAGAYINLNGSYDTYATGAPNPLGPTGPIGGPLLHDLGRGVRLKFYAQVVLAVLSAGAATLECDFISGAGTGGGAVGDLTSAPTVLLQTPAIAKASLVQGYRFRHGATPGVVPQRYVGAQWVIGGATVTQGKVTSGLMLDVDDHADVLG